MDIVLIAGLWLRAEVWDPTIEHLADLGHTARAVRLPGVDVRGAEATLADQLDAVLTAVDAAERPLVVGHSAASTLAHLAADRRREGIAGTVLIGGFPTTEGEQYAAFFPLTDGVMPFPGWEPFEGPDSDDLDADARTAIAEAAVPVPGPVVTAAVHYLDPLRTQVPTWELCPEFSPADAQAWIASGDLPELAAAEHLQLADIDSGHWPMVSRPQELARVLTDIANAAPR